jgi:pre-mRNA-splicing factor SYF1
LEPQNIEDYIDYLISVEKYTEATRRLAQIVNDEKFVSQQGKSKHQLWLKLCDLVSQHPAEVDKSINVERFLRSGIQQFTDEVGKLWTALATYYIRLAMFEKVRHQTTHLEKKSILLIIIQNFFFFFLLLGNRYL